MADRHPNAVDPIISEARERWARCDEAEGKQRASILVAKQFRAGDQWPDDVKIARQGGAAIQGQAVQPPKPLVSIDRISQPVRQTSNQIKQADFGIDVLPNGHGADDDTSKIFKGYIRRVQNLARGESPIEWAADQAIEGGLGWFRLRTAYVRDDYDPKQPQADQSFFDQELRLERITNNLTVYCDPCAQKPTKSDAEYLFVTEDLSRDEFTRRWPKAKEVGVDDLSGTGKIQKWADADVIRIAEYWRRTYQPVKLCLLSDGRVVPLEEAPDKQAIVQQRTVQKPKVECFTITACEVLEHADWLGSHIPLIPVLGEELNVDGTVLYRGMIQSAMDPQRMVNYHYSGAIMAVANATLTPWLIAEGQIETYEAYWQNANRFNYAYLPWKPTTIAGIPVPPPQRNSASTDISSIVQLLAISEDAIKATMAFWDPSLGKSSGSQESGRKVLALQKQSEIANSNFADNVMRALIYAGELMVEIAPKITRPGQLLHILGVDDVPEAVYVGQQFQPGQNGAPPQAVAEPGVKPVFGFDQQMLQKGAPKFYDLANGKYAVTVTIGKDEATMRNEGISAVSELIPHLPPQVGAAITPSIIREMSFPGAQKIAEIAENALPPELRMQKEGEQDPKAIQQENAQLKMALQEMQPLADKNKADLLKVQQQGQMDYQIKQLEMHAADLRQQREIAAKIEIARIGAAKQAADLDAEAQEERFALGVNITHEQTQNELDRRHDLRLASQAHAQALQQADQGHQQALEQGAQSVAGQSQLQAESAAQQPQESA